MIQMPFLILEPDLEAREQAGIDCAEEGRAQKHKRTAEQNMKATNLCYRKNKRPPQRARFHLPQGLLKVH